MSINAKPSHTNCRNQNMSCFPYHHKFAACNNVIQRIISIDHTEQSVKTELNIINKNSQ